MEEIAKVFGLDWRLLIIQAINFGILLAVLWYFLYRPVLAMIDARRAKIEEGVRDAELAKERLTEVADERTVILQKATDTADTLLENAKQQAHVQSSELITTATERADATIQSAHAQAQEMKAQSLRESEAEITQAAMLAAAKILQEKQS